MKLQDSDFTSEYGDLRDEELILRAREGDIRIPDYLIEKYKPLVKSKAKSMYILGADREDLIQEGMIGLFKAVRDYDAGRDASFFTFAELCISRQMYTAVTESGRKKHAPLNSYISLSDKGDSEEEGSFSLEEKISISLDDNPEKLVIDRENMNEIKKYMEDELSRFEREALELSLTGMSYTEVAKVLNRDEKSTDNAIQRAKGKLKKLIKKAF